MKHLHMCIFSILTYGVQTWSLTKGQMFKLGTLMSWMCQEHKQLMYLVQKAAKFKGDYAGHVCRMPIELWAKTTTDCDKKTQWDSTGL